jgi:hypothetical protein
MDSIRRVSSPARLGQWKMYFLAIEVILIAMLAAAPAFAQATTFRENVSFPIDQSLFVPCARGGLGEQVHLSGIIHLLSITTLDGRGGYQTKLHYQTQGLSGYGEITGIRYQGMNATQISLIGKVGFQETFANNFRIVGQGPGNNLELHQTFHMTVNPNGVVTVVTENFTSRCRSASYP